MTPLGSALSAVGGGSHLVKNIVQRESLTWEKKKPLNLGGEKHESSEKRLNPRERESYSDYMVETQLCNHSLDWASIKEV